MLRVILTLVCLGSFGIDVFAGPGALRGTDVGLEHRHYWPYPAELIYNALRIRLSKEFVNRKLFEIAKSINATHLNEILAAQNSNPTVIATQVEEQFGYNITLGEVRVDGMGIGLWYKNSTIDVDIEMRAQPQIPSFWVQIWIEGYVNVGGIQLALPQIPIWIYLIQGHLDFSLEKSGDWLKHSGFDLDLSQLSEDYFAPGFGRQAFWQSMPMAFGNLVFGGAPQSAYNMVQQLTQSLLRKEVPSRVQDKLAQAVHVFLKNSRRDSAKRKRRAYNFRGASMNVPLSFDYAINNLDLDDDAIYLDLNAGFGGQGYQQAPPILCPQPIPQRWSSERDVSVQAVPSLVHQLIFQLWQSGQLELPFSSETPPFNQMKFPIVKQFYGNVKVSGAPEFKDCFIAYRVSTQDLDIDAAFDALGQEIHMKGGATGDMVIVPHFNRDHLSFESQGISGVKLTLDEPNPKSFLGQFVDRFFVETFLPKMSQALSGFMVGNVSLPAIAVDVFNRTIWFNYTSMRFNPASIQVELDEFASGIDGIAR